MSICPKNKSSKARRDKRRANWKMSAPNLVKCSKCGALMMSSHEAVVALGLVILVELVELYNLYQFAGILRVGGSKKSEKSEADTYMILELERQIALMVEKELLQKPWSEAVSVKKLVIFFQSSLAQRMAKAQHLQKLKKEQPFVLGIAADRVKPQFPHEEQVLIQGIIDAFFEEGDDLILMDYKTDAVKTGEELVKRYHTQMEYYTEALERIVGKKVKERIIYSFALGEEIRM